MSIRVTRPSVSRLRQYILTGLLVVLPVWVTWLIFQFLLRLVSSAGTPLVQAVARSLAEEAPRWSQWLLLPWVQTLSAVLLILLLLYLLGWSATRVVGKRVLALVDRLMERIPLIQTVYGSTRRLLAALQQKPTGAQRVVLIDFPSPEMKAVGVVTRTFTDERTGQLLAAVYVPTTPNPTSGYLEIVPLEKVVPTDWTLDDAMAFIISGGAVGPDKMTYSRGTTSVPEASHNRVSPES